MRYFWAVVALLAVGVPAYILWWGWEYNVHTSSSVGGPVTFALCIFIAIGFEGVLLTAAMLVLGGHALWLLRRDKRTVDLTDTQNGRPFERPSGRAR